MLEESDTERGPGGGGGVLVDPPPQPVAKAEAASTAKCIALSRNRWRFMSHLLRGGFHRGLARGILPLIVTQLIALCNCADDQRDTWRIPGSSFQSCRASRLDVMNVQAWPAKAGIYLATWLVINPSCSINPFTQILLTTRSACRFRPKHRSELSDVACCTMLRLACAPTPALLPSSIA